MIASTNDLATAIQNEARNSFWNDGAAMTGLLLNLLRWLSYAASGGSVPSGKGGGL
jgi:hypothetical protein